MRYQCDRYEVAVPNKLASLKHLPCSLISQNYAGRATEDVCDLMGWDFAVLEMSGSYFIYK